MWNFQFGTIEVAPVIASQMTPLGTSLCAGYTLAVSRLLRCRNTAVARALSTSQQRWTLDTPFISDTIPLAEGVLGTVEELIAQVGQPVDRGPVLEPVARQALTPSRFRKSER